MLRLLPIIFILNACTNAHIIKADLWPQAGKESVLTSTDARFSLKDLYREPKALVLIFWQKGCPCVKRYQSRILDLYRQFSPQKIAFVYVSSNSEPFAEALTEYQKRNEPLTLLRDEKGLLAKDLGVKGTPSVAVIDQTGDVRYLGWIDNERRPGEKGRIPYLENALLDIINDRVVATKTSPMFGCAIR